MFCARFGTGRVNVRPYRDAEFVVSGVTIPLPHRVVVQLSPIVISDRAITALAAVMSSDPVEL